MLLCVCTLPKQLFSHENEAEPEPVPGSQKGLDVNVLNTSDINFCFEDRTNAKIELQIENNGLDTISSLQLGWEFTNNQRGNISWVGSIAPNSSRLVTLTYLNFPSEGIFLVDLWASCVAQDLNPLNDTVSISVNVLSPLYVNSLEDTAVCENDFVVFAAPKGFNSYVWSDGSLDDSILVSTPGLYGVTLTDQDGCSAVDSVYLSNLASPGALLSNDTILCDSVILIPEVSDKFLSYSWGMGDTVSNIQITQAGEYVLHVVDTLGCSYTDTMNVTYAAPPNPGVPTQVFICQGDSALLSVSPNFSSYSWSTGSNTSSISTTAPGLYYVTVTGSAGCIGMDTVEVLVNPLPVISFYDSLMCNLSPFMLDVGYFEGFQWSNGDTIQNPIVNIPGMYSVTVTDNNGCQSSDTVNLVNFNVEVSLGGDTSICSGDGSFIILDIYDSYIWNDGHTGPSQFIGDPGVYSVTVSSSGCSASDEIEVTEILYPDVYFSEYLNTPDVEFTNLSNLNTNLLWDFGDGNQSTALNPTHTYQNNGLYDVTLTIQNECGVDTHTESVGVFPLGDNPLASNELGIKLYPTLTNDVLNIEVKEFAGEEIQYSVFDVAGKLLISKRYINSQDYIQEIDVSNFASGTYLVRLASESNFIGVREFIKK